MSPKKKIKYGVMTGFISTLIGLVAGGYYSYFKGIRNSTFNKQKAITTDPEKYALSNDSTWFSQIAKQEVFTTSEDGLKLNGYFIKHPDDKHQGVILAHGYRHERFQMISYAKLFYEMGFDVLMPDARGHGTSGGNHIGFGWLDRRDYITWTKLLIGLTHADEKIVLMGISMGAAGVLATAGEKDVSQNVVGVIADSSFDNLFEEFHFRMKYHYHLPFKILTEITSGFTKILAGYSFREANILHQVAKIKVPILFIHGESDHYVPTKMMDNLVNEAKQPVNVYIGSHSDHVRSFHDNPILYKRAIKEFLQQNRLDK